MAEGKRRGWRLAAALAVFSALILGCRSAEPRRPTTSGAGLDEGPTRWLMLPEEERQYRRLRTTREVVDFIEEFWRRRDPEPDKPGNPFAKTFYERVEAADHLYSEGGTRGSLTDRGRAMALLGPPPVLRYGQKKVPAWNPGRPGAPPAVQTQALPLETWVYPFAELPPALQQLILDDEGPVAEITLVFAADPRHTDLIDGEKYLKMAARAAVQR
ncbi:MAG TPA: GWxTD domain-containing protein [Thermoanaerobaculia bacterium]|jgi:GWxTD domain-containing protein